MSLKLREIINAFAEKNPNFFRNSKEQIIEKTSDGNEKATGFYQNDEGEFFEEEAWFEMVRVEKERIRKENELRMQKWQEEQAALLKQQQERIDQQPKENGKKNYKIIFLILIFGGIAAAVFYFITPFGNIEEDKEITEAPVEVESEPVVQEIFGNATITGDGVNIRNQPTLNGAVVGNVPQAGERVQILQKPIDTKEWLKILRKNKDSGWVYYKYVNDSI